MKDKIKKEVDKRRNVYSGGKRPKMGSGYLETETRKIEDAVRRRDKALKALMKG